MANLTQVPVIHSDNGDLTQTQTNVNKALRNLDSKIVSITDKINNLIILGEIKLSSLTLAQFQNQAGTSWILANGQSSVNTDYSRLTGNNTVPNISVTGSNAFIRVNYV